MHCTRGLGTDSKRLGFRDRAGDGPQRTRHPDFRFHGRWTDRVPGTARPIRGQLSDGSNARGGRRRRARGPTSRSPPAVEPAKEGDRIYRVQANGVERIDGAVEGFSEGGVRFHGELVGTIAIPWRSVGALFVEHLGSKPPRIDERALPVAVDLVDGSRIAGLFLGLKGGVIELNRRGTTLRIPVDAALQIGRDDGSIAFLANTAPASDEPSRPYGDDLGMVWRSRVDRNVSGGALVVGGARQARGLGVHAPSRTTWALDGSFSTLRGSVALDDEVLRLSARGSCVFRVLLDGREAFASPVVKAGDAPVAFTIPLGASKEVALVVDPTSDGFAGDRANWLGLLLARDQAAGASER